MSRENDNRQCSQNSPHCLEAPAYRYTWPGQDEAFICATHAPKLRAVAKAIGYYVQMIPLEEKTP
jgi:hypothetical protein